MKNEKYLYLNSRDSFYRLDTSKIVFFEADGNYTRFVMSYNKLKGMAGFNLLTMAKILGRSLGSDASMFARIGKRFIVNLTYVYYIDIPKQRLVLSDGASFAYQLPVSKEALKTLRDMFVGSVKTKKNDDKR